MSREKINQQKKSNKRNYGKEINCKVKTRTWFETKYSDLYLLLYQNVLKALAPYFKNCVGI